MAKTKDKKMTKDPGKRVEVEVNLPLSAQEKVRRGEKALCLMRERDHAELERKEMSDRYKARIKGLDGMAKKLLEEFETSTELKMVTAIEKRNFATGKMEYHYKGKVIKTRELTFADRQDELPLKAKKKADTLTEEQQRGKACAAPSSKKHPEPETKEDSDLQDAIKSATSRKTAHSSVDGIAGNAVAAQ